MGGAMLIPGVAMLAALQGTILPPPQDKCVSQEAVQTRFVTTFTSNPDLFGAVVHEINVLTGNYQMGMVVKDQPRVLYAVFGKDECLIRYFEIPVQEEHLSLFPPELRW